MTTLDVDRIFGIEVARNLCDLEFIAFDVETTGLSAIACKLVELSAVRFRLNGVPEEIYSTLIDPEMEIPPEVSAIHGITDSMVKGAPTAKEALPGFLEFVGDRSVLLAHNAPFDIGFLRVGLSRLGLTTPALAVVDTLSLSRSVVYDVPNYQLKTLTEFFGVQANDYHRALADSHHVREIFSCMLKCNEDIRRWADLVDLNTVMPLAPPDVIDEVPESLSGHASAIKQAIKEGKAMRLVYSGAGSYGFSRVIRPLAMLENRGYYYLSAFCQQADAERTFRIDRIKSLTVLS